MDCESLINIVLYQPEIPYNTGNIIRSCATFKSSLHLIRPYGFFINDKRLMRASIDYLKQIHLIEHDCMNDFLNLINSDDLIFFVTKKGKLLPNQIDFSFLQNKKIYLIFGCETSGLPQEIIEKFNNLTLRIPIAKESRCLNLSNTVACLLYEVYRQNNFKNLELIYET
ncbi:tRNA (uridine(34)/cytosine(34)/5-carboxymethylaminomethyluridine(34)-2'-O)-methyltransferase TrmL [Mycoplasmoides alvi]|uniref:tRNA (uridine(34)/cytosine(34)/5- carboxymethylaminomethyluridine(34)-2'-O)- methyltransferase TrmL n=1 Tax=Mycoplasmoides alvi TaxID=78580 RepID=UPI0009FDF77B|nr:tRNA (uridine(34)/cytosine(34)/5-carboxymethylaminomethyluridine(34)-2'-O)-methyltransferase TrmL [Mycoplasmoides alvi]